MNLIKYGIGSVLVACAAVVACGGSSSGDGNGSGAGTSSSSAGTSSSSGGSSSNGTGGSSTTSGGSATTITGGCGSMTDPTASMCPAAVSCVETNCKSDFDSLESTTGPCADYVKCGTACNCNTSCVANCTMSAACTAAFQKVITCTEQNCLSQSLACASNTGGAGGGFSFGGAGGAFSFGGSSGAFSFGGATATETCADLNTCCAKLTNADEKSSCTSVVAQKSDLACSLVYAELCASN